MCKRYFFILFVLKICTFRFANYTIPYTIFFLFFHVDNSRIIKTQVLQWINQKQQLMP